MKLSVLFLFRFFFFKNNSNTPAIEIIKTRLLVLVEIADKDLDFLGVPKIRGS